MKKYCSECGHKLESEIDWDSIRTLVTSNKPSYPNKPVSPDITTKEYIDDSGSLVTEVTGGGMTHVSSINRYSYLYKSAIEHYKKNL